MPSFSSLSIVQNTLDKDCSSCNLQLGSSVNFTSRFEKLRHLCVHSTFFDLRNDDDSIKVTKHRMFLIKTWSKGTAHLVNLVPPGLIVLRHHTRSMQGTIIEGHGRLWITSAYHKVTGVLCRLSLYALIQCFVFEDRIWRGS